MTVLELATKSQFKKDLRLMQRRGKNPHKLWQIVDILLAEGNLPEKHRNHKLTGCFCISPHAHQAKNKEAKQRV